MESLVNLAVCVDQLRVVHGKNIVDAEVYVCRSVDVFVPKNWHPDCRHVAKCSWLRNFLYDLAAVLDKEMLVVSHPVVEDYTNINIGGHCPQAVLSAASRHHSDFAVEH